MRSWELGNTIIVPALRCRVCISFTGAAATPDSCCASATLKIALAVM